MTDSDTANIPERRTVRKTHLEQWEQFSEEVDEILALTAEQFKPRLVWILDKAVWVVERGFPS
jgi:hypothetical protein